MNSIALVTDGEDFLLIVHRGEEVYGWRLNDMTREQRYEVGMAASAATLHLGQIRSQLELARACGVSHQAIQQVEKRGLRKLRPHLLGEHQMLHAIA